MTLMHPIVSGLGITKVVVFKGFPYSGQFQPTAHVTDVFNFTEDEEIATGI